MYDLYYSPGAFSMSVHVVAEELGIDYKGHKVRIKEGEHKNPEYLKINPRGQVSSLTMDEGNIAENAAIIVYLNDEHGGSLIPAKGFKRAQALQWLMFANATLHQSYAVMKFASFNELGDHVIEKACENIQAKWDDIENHLETSGYKYLAGDECTAGDLYIAVCSNWSFIPFVPNFGPKTTQLIKSVVSRPAYKKVLEEEGIKHRFAS